MHSPSRDSIEGQATPRLLPMSFLKEPGSAILMFSGGRDSSLAALRLNQAKRSIALVTVTSGHLIGLERVRRRVKELAQRLPPGTRWIVLEQPIELRTDTSFYEMTCLPCHHAYVVSSAVVARAAGASRLAFGYAKYQSDWPEQTPLGVESLRSVLGRHGIHLELPVHDLQSREQAIAELTAHGLTGEALEQKCMQQINNVRLDDEKLRKQIVLWEEAIDKSMGEIANIDIKIIFDNEIQGV